MTNIDHGFGFMTRNPKMAEKYFYEIMQLHIAQIRSGDPFAVAIVIDQIPDLFPKWKAEAEKYSDIKKQKKIQEYIDILETFLFEYEYPSETEQRAINSVRPYLTEQLEYWYKELKALPPQQTNTEDGTIRYTAKHYVLAYLFECNVKGESYPMGNKKELERIGNERMGAGKGNSFYKRFNEIVHKDLNVENNLIEIGGENWRKIIKELSNDPETIETYLQNKQL